MEAASRFETIILFVKICIVLTWIDAIVTYVGITFFGGSEGHPLLAWLMSVIGTLPSILVYAIVISLALVFVTHLCRVLHERLVRAKKALLWIIQVLLIIKMVTVTYVIIAWIVGITLQLI